ncbi:MAG TPA: PrpF domain-containing protein [Rhabdochlamydiaceae bacterium]|nr:PrpF domain-containing protein [Rhabdochlamydiaceae bacterium]
MKQQKIRASLIRGGTSKGLFLNEDDLPKNSKQRDSLLLSIMGSPDSTGMQLDGLGGGISSTSKVALISKSGRKNIHINYLFGQVSLTNPKIDWSGSCGNLVAGVALYAINESLVKPNKDGSAQISIWQANLNHEIHVKVYPPIEENLISIPGVPGKSFAIYVDFINPSPSLLPENKPIHILTLPNGKKIEATLISGANPTIFVNATDLGLAGDELPKNLDFKKIELLINALSFQGTQIMNIPNSLAVRVAWVSPPKDCRTSDDFNIKANECDLLSRIATEGRIHHAYTGTGAINLACAVKIPNSIPNKIVKNKANSKPLRIAHPMGVMLVDANIVQDPKTRHWIATNAGFMRTARILMQGVVYTKSSL